MTTDFDYCADLVYKRDRDRYWCALMAPAAFKNDLFALYAFNAEISEIGISITEPLIGHMRLRWWLDILDPIFAGTPPDHPVARALANVVTQKDISQNVLVDLIESRERDIEGGPFPSLKDFKDYTRKTSTPLITEVLKLMDILDAGTSQAADHLAQAAALTGLIRSVPYHLQRGQVLMPLDCIETTGFDPQELLDHGYRGQLPNGLSAVISQLIDATHLHIQESTTHWPRSAPKYPAPMLQKHLVLGYLRELAAVNNDPFQMNLSRSGPSVRSMIQLKWASLFSRYESK